MKRLMREEIILGPHHVIEIVSLAFDQRYGEQLAGGLLREVGAQLDDVPWSARRPHPDVPWEVELLPQDDTAVFQASSAVVPTEDGGYAKVALDESDATTTLTAWFQLFAEADWVRNRELSLMVGRSREAFCQRIAKDLEARVSWPTPAELAAGPVVYALQTHAGPLFWETSTGRRMR